MGKPTGRPNGRPRAEEKVDAEALRALIFAGCTQFELADYFGISPDSIQRMANREPYAKVMQRAKAERKLSLRRAQTKLAMSGNVGMLIWLGKQELGQREPRFEPPTELSLEELRDALLQVQDKLKDYVEPPPDEDLEGAKE